MINLTKRTLEGIGANLRPDEVRSDGSLNCDTNHAVALAAISAACSLKQISNDLEAIKDVLVNSERALRSPLIRKLFDAASAAALKDMQDT